MQIVSQNAEWDFLDMSPDFLSEARYLFIEVRKRTFFKFVAKKFHPKLINSCVNFNIFQKLHMLNYIMNLLYAVPKSPKWFFLYDFSLPTEFR